MQVTAFVDTYRPDLTNIPHFMIYNDLPSDVSLVGVDARIWVLTGGMNRLGYQALSTPNGCWHRCIAVPFQNIGAPHPRPLPPEVRCKR
eukprot:g36982.t1